MEKEIDDENLKRKSSAKTKSKKNKLIFNVAGFS